MMNDHIKERSMMEHPSRRSFLGMSSVALATAAFAGLTANAQEKASTQKAEHDHSTSDPGQENKPLLTENPNSNTPPPTDHGDVVPLWYSFDLVKKRVEEGGWTHEVTETVLPSSKDIAGVNLWLTAGSYREMHWHNARTMDFNANDVGYVPSNAPHYIENTGDTDLILLETLATAEFSDISLNQWLRHVPSEMLKAHLNIDKEIAMKIPAEKLVVI
jgi:oxalate decarboxylase